MFKLIPRTQAEIQTNLERRLKDTSNDRWSDADMYDAINQALSVWGNRVLVPFFYTLTSGFSTNEKEYALPEYVEGPYIDVVWQVSGEDHWRDWLIYEVQPSTGGGKVLRLDYYPPDVDVRVLYWTNNSPVPTTLATINANITTTTATSCTIGSTPTIAPNGFIKIGAEWMSYQGYTLAASSITLNNLSRGLFGTTAATHSSSATVNFGIVSHRPDAFEQLQQQAMVFLHMMYVTNASGTETDKHQWNVRWWQGLADNFWKGWVPMRSPKVMLSRQGIAPITRDYSSNQYYRTHDMGWFN